MTVPKNHASLLNANHVQQLCSPLFQKTEISYFHYAKMFDDGRVSILVTNTAYHQHFWEKKYNEDFFPNYKPGIFFNEPCATRGLEDGRKYFNIDHMMMLLTRGHDYFEVFGFATHAGNDKILSYYMHHMDQLLNFGNDFKDKASSLIKTSDDNTIISPGYKPSIIVPDNKSIINLANSTVKKSNAIVPFNISGVQLTQRQSEVLYYTARGKMAKEIAQILGLSYRTVQHYLENVKEKLNVSTRSQLIELVISSINSYDSPL